MRNFEDVFKTCKRSFISAFSICMTVPLRSNHSKFISKELNKLYLGLSYAINFLRTKLMKQEQNTENNVTFLFTYFEEQKEIITMTLT